MKKRIIVIGGAGEMNREAIKRIIANEPEVELHLTDINLDAVKAAADELGGLSYDRLDLFDAAAVRSAIQGADLVLNGAGPYVRTAEPVMNACLEVGVTYLDFDDDPESTITSLGFDARAEEAGVSLLIGAGASPGYSNVLAADVAAQLDSVEAIDICWSTGDEGAHPFGDAVLEHCLHMYVGTTTSCRGGELATIELGHSEMFDMGPGFGSMRVYEVAHPEPITLQRRYPGLRNARCLGTFDPAPVNGIFKGLAKAAYGDDNLTLAEATQFLQAVLVDKEPDAKGWKYALDGMWEQVLTGEIDIEEMFGVLRAAVQGQHLPYVCMLTVKATGVKDGRPTTVTRRLGSAPGWNSMADVTGACTAAFVSLALSNPIPAGVQSPEDWVVPAEFFATLEAQGAPAEIVVAPEYIYSVPAAS